MPENSNLNTNTTLVVKSLEEFLAGEGKHAGNLKSEYRYITGIQKFGRIPGWEREVSWKIPG
jgi:hypothetical protein